MSIVKKKQQTKKKPIRHLDGVIFISRNLGIIKKNMVLNPSGKIDLVYIWLLCLSKIALQLFLVFGSERFACCLSREAIWRKIILHVLGLNRIRQTMLTIRGNHLINTKEAWLGYYCVRRLLVLNLNENFAPGRLYTNIINQPTKYKVSQNTIPRWQLLIILIIKYK